MNTVFPQQAFGTALTDSATTPSEEVGVIRYEIDPSTGTLRGYKYVQAAADTTVANGTVLTFVDDESATVTSDISDSKQNFVAGVGVGAIAASSYGWIQIYGPHSAIATNGDDDIAKGDTLIADASADGVCNSVAAGTASTHKPLGYALADDVDGSNTVSGFIDCGV